MLILAHIGAQLALGLVLLSRFLAVRAHRKRMRTVGMQLRTDKGICTQHEWTHKCEDIYRLLAHHSITQRDMPYLRNYGKCPLSIFPLASRGDVHRLALSPTESRALPTPAILAGHAQCNTCKGASALRYHGCTPHPPLFAARRA